MRALQTPATLRSHKQSAIHWKRIVLAAFLSEVAVIAVLSVIIITHRFVIAPALTPAQYDEFAQNAGYYVAAPTAAIATFVFAFLAARRLEADLITNGVLVGVIATLLTLGFVFGARPQDRLMYIISYLGRIIAGYAGGFAAQKINDGIR